MTVRPRRLALNLTALLDLLLVIVFLQYIDARTREADSLAAASRAEQASADAVRERDELRGEYERTQAELTAARGQAAALEADVERSEGHLDRALAQHRVLGELVVELFGIPPQDVAKVLDPAQRPSGNQSPDELERLRARFREMATQDPGRMIQHLLSYEEIRKRCDLWELHIAAPGLAEVDAGNESFRFRVAPDEFEQEFFRLYKSLPQSKGLVIILLTYDRAAEIQFIKPVREALPRIVDRMREDSGGLARFEYADLGIRID